MGDIDELVSIGMGALVLYVVFIDPVISKSKGNRSLLDRIIGSLLIGGPSFWQKKHRDDNDESAAINLILAVALGAIAYKALQKTYLFLRDVDWNSLSTQNKEALSRFKMDIDQIRDNRSRLSRAENLVLIGDRLSIEESALLASATLEAGLKDLGKHYGIVLTEEQSEGIVGLATALRDKAVISSTEYREIRRYTAIVRNKVMHGEFDALEGEDVRTLVGFIRDLFDAHQLD